MYYDLSFNNYSNILFILSLLMILSSIMLIFTVNPIHSLLFLVLIFLLTTCFFLLLKIEFISMLFLVVYLGAIIGVLRARVINNYKEYQLFNTVPSWYLLGTFH